MKREFEVVNWNRIEELSIRLAELIVSSGFRPTVIVAVMRGGYIVARLLSDLLNVPRVLTITIKSYTGIGVRASSPMVIAGEVNVKGEQVLIVDDVTDSGNTMRTAVNYISTQGPRLIKTAVLFHKPWSMVKPDYYSSETTRWIIFPWSIAEVLRQLSVNRDPGDIAREVGLNKHFNEEIINSIINIIKHTMKVR